MSKECYKIRPKDIPDDFPVKPVSDKSLAEKPTTCGCCGLTWDDSIITSYTPSPSGRCPFEYYHDYFEPDNWG